MQPYTLSVASTHRCTHTTLCRYATKEEKATKTCKSLLDEAIRRAQEKGVDDEEGAVRIFSSYLVQQVGGRDWSAQEVSHVNMGLHTTWGSHEFNERNLTLLSRLRKNISREDDDTRRADLPSDFELYLNRWKWIFEGKHAVDPSQPLINGESHERAADILLCSFAQFYRKYEYGSAGTGKKGKRIIHKIERPTVCVIKPQMPRSWDKLGHPKRADYCRVQLQAYKTFNSKADDTTADDNYDAYMTKHGGSFESAYEEFANSPEAPSCCRDDFKAIEFEDEGNPVGDDRGEAHHGFAVFEARTYNDPIENQLQIEPVDWWARNTDGRYSDELLADAARWQTRVKASSTFPAAVTVDTARLNDGQAFIYRVVEEHDTAWRSGLKQLPLLALICGTAGSGKVTGRCVAG
jgi:hypothetical protein